MTECMYPKTTTDVVANRTFTLLIPLSVTLIHVKRKLRYKFLENGDGDFEKKCYWY